MAHEADTYWFAVLAGTAVYDAWALHTSHETASSAMRRYTEAPWQKFMLCGVLGGLAVHFLAPELSPPDLLINHLKIDRNDQI